MPASLVRSVGLERVAVDSDLAQLGVLGCGLKSEVICTCAFAN